MKNHYYHQFAKSSLSLILAASMMLPSPVALAVVSNSSDYDAIPPDQVSSSESDSSTSENNGSQTTVSFVGTGSEAYNYRFLSFM